MRHEGRARGRERLDDEIDLAPKADARGDASPRGLGFDPLTAGRDQRLSG
jgi:hypothetical protein